MYNVNIPYWRSFSRKKRKPLAGPQNLIKGYKTGVTGGRMLEPVYWPQPSLYTLK
jgi:hypothetical protein